MALPGYRMLRMIRLDWALTVLVILATFTVIFMVGVSASASGLLPWLKDVPGISAESPEAPRTLPLSDAPGRDMPGLERYPASVRVKYERYSLGESEVVEVGYLTDSGLREVGAFYEGMSRGRDWHTEGSDAGTGDELGILITRDTGEDKRQVLIEIEPQGELVSVELEESVADSV